MQAGKLTAGCIGESTQRCFTAPDPRVSTDVLNVLVLQFLTFSPRYNDFSSPGEINTGFALHCEKNYIFRFCRFLLFMN